MPKTKALAERNKIISNGYKRMAQVLLAQGITVDALLKTQSLSRAQAFSGQHPHSFNQLWRFVRNVLNNTQINGLGLLMGAQVTLSDYGILGYAMLSGSTLGEVSRYGINYRLLSSNVIDMSLQVEDGLAIYGFWENTPSNWSQPYHIEEAIASSWKVMQDLLPQVKGVPPLRINLAFAKPSYSHLYQLIFQCPVYFNQTANQIVYPQHWLDLPINSADEVTAAICSEQCALINDHLQNRGDTVENVRRILLSSPQSSIPGLKQMASKLRLSERTFRRQLYDANTHYKEVVNEVRIQLALEYLQVTQLSMKEIAYLVGYDHSSNFCRAFKKAIGIAPSQFKSIKQDY